MYLLSVNTFFIITAILQTRKTSFVIPSKCVGKAIEN